MTTTIRSQIQQIREACDRLAELPAVLDDVEHARLLIRVERAARQLRRAADRLNGPERPRRRTRRRHDPSATVTTEGPHP